MTSRQSSMRRCCSSRPVTCRECRGQKTTTTNVVVVVVVVVVGCDVDDDVDLSAVRMMMKTCQEQRSREIPAESGRLTVDSVRQVSRGPAAGDAKFSLSDSRSPVKAARGGIVF